MSKDDKHYIIRFDALFKYKDIGSIYYTFLKKDHSEETWEFLTELKKISEDDKDFETKIDKIVETFVNDGAKKEINISHEAKANCLEKFQKKKSLKCFNEIQQILINEMKYDSFKRFVRSKECLSVIKKYHSNAEVCTPVLATKFNYKNEDFVEHKVLEDDLKFMDILYKDSPVWELLTSFKDGDASGNSFWSIENYIPDVTIAPCVSVAKYDLILPYSFERVLCAFFPLAEQIKFDPQCGKYETYNYTVDEEGRSHASIMYNVTFDYPFNCRFYPMVASGSYNPGIKKCVQIFKPCEMEHLKDHEWMQPKVTQSLQRKGKKEEVKKAYKMYDFQSSHIQKLDENKTAFTQIHLYALGGWITNKALMKTIAKSRGKDLLKDLVKNIKKTPEDSKLSELNKAPTFEGDGLARILYDLKIPEKDQEYAEKHGSFVMEDAVIQEKKVVNEKVFEEITVEGESKEEKISKDEIVTETPPPETVSLQA